MLKNFGKKAPLNKVVAFSELFILLVPERGAIEAAYFNEGVNLEYPIVLAGIYKGTYEWSKLPDYVADSMHRDWNYVANSLSAAHSIKNYKKWISKAYPEESAPTYQVHYDTNGGSNAPSAQTKTKDVPLVLSSAAPVRNGYSFQGWSASPDAESVSYAPGETYSENKPLTLYAVWRQNALPVSIPSVTSPTAEAGCRRRKQKPKIKRYT